MNFPLIDRLTAAFEREPALMVGAVTALTGHSEWLDAEVLARAVIRLVRDDEAICGFLNEIPPDGEESILWSGKLARTLRDVNAQHHVPAFDRLGALVDEYREAVGGSERR